MSTPNPLELEQLPETKNYRASRRQIWTLLEQEFRKARDEALQHRASSLQATQYAAKRIRGEVAVFLWDLLPHGHRDAVALFFEHAPAGWIPEPELLFGLPVVPDLIERSYSKVIWAQGNNKLTREYAEDREKLEKHAIAMMETYFGGVGTAVGALGNGLGKAVEGVGEAIGGVGEAIGGIGSGVGGFARNLGTIVKYVPFALAAAALGVLGIAVARVSAELRERRPQQPALPGMTRTLWKGEE